MTNNNDVKTTFLSLASYQDSLLQSYRAIFISSQSIIISITALIVTLTESSIQKMIIVPVLFVIGIIIIFFWVIITEDRASEVSYCHLKLIKLEKNNEGLSEQEINNLFSDFKSFEIRKDNKDKKCEINYEFKKILDIDKKLTNEKTRVFFQRWLPIMYVILWVVILIGTLVQFYRIF